MKPTVVNGMGEGIVVKDAITANQRNIRHNHYINNNGVVKISVNGIKLKELI